MGRLIVWQDADRHTDLSKLPDVLTLQLLRFVYDASISDRKKVSTSPYFVDLLASIR